MPFLDKSTTPWTMWRRKRCSVVTLNWTAGVIRFLLREVSLFSELLLELGSLAFTVSS